MAWNDMRRNARCLLRPTGYELACPHVIHRKPEKYRKSKEKTHPFQLSPQQLSTRFADALDESGVYDNIDKDKRPTLHKLIGLGEFLRKKSGWTEEQIQQLRGHSKLSTTMIYLEGHEWKTIIYPEQNQN